jgi:hypothetical protein
VFQFWHLLITKKMIRSILLLARVYLIVFFYSPQQQLLGSIIFLEEGVLIFEGAKGVVSIFVLEKGSWEKMPDFEMLELV